LDAVDRICDDDLLRDFWLNGKAVVSTGPVPWNNRAKKLKLPPFPRAGDPDNRRRWLACSANDESTIQYLIDAQSYSGQMNVYANATQSGGRWLVYAMTPFAGTGTVTVNIPDAGDVEIDLGQTPGGDYWLVEPAGVKASKLAR